MEKEMAIEIKKPAAKPAAAAEKPAEKAAAKVEKAESKAEVKTDESVADKAAKDAAKAQEQSIKAEQKAIEKAATINQRLIRDGNPRRIIGGVRNGEPKFFWGNFVPTQELSDEEVKAVETV